MPPGAESRRCRLCGLERDLCDSHVVPEFVYGPLYNKQGKMLGLRMSEQGVKPQLVQKGLREPLLCAVCEAHVNTHFEQPSRRPWRALAGLEQDPSLKSRVLRTPQGQEFRVLTGFDYPSFKLFLLSILWRAGVSTRGEYQQVELGPHEGRLRRMLHERDPGGRADYPCLLILAKQEFRGIYAPFRAPFGTHDAYRFLLGRVLLWFVVSEQFGSDPHMQGALTEQGQWVAHMVELSALPEFQEAERLARTIDVPARMLIP